MSKLELEDLKNIIKISNKLSEEQIGKILSELKEDPNFVVDIDRSLSDTLLKFNKLYGDEGISKVKFIINQYGKFNNEKPNNVTVGGKPLDDVVVVKSPKQSKFPASAVVASLAATTQQAQQAQQAAQHATAQRILQELIEKGESADRRKELLIELSSLDQTVIKAALVSLQGAMPMFGMVQPMPVAGFQSIGSPTSGPIPSNIDTMALLSRHGYLAHTPVYPGGSQNQPQTGGFIPEDDFKMELNENEEGLTGIPIIGGSVSLISNLPTIDISFNEMIGGGTSKMNVPTIYLAEDVEGMIGVPTIMDLFGLQEQANQIGGADDESPTESLEMSESTEGLTEMAEELDNQETPELGSDEPIIDGGALYSDELCTLSDISFSN